MGWNGFVILEKLHWPKASQPLKTGGRLNDPFPRAILKPVTSKGENGIYVYTAAEPEQAKSQLTYRSQFPRVPTEHTIIDILLAAVMVSQATGELTIAAVMQKLEERKNAITEAEVTWVFHKYGLEKKRRTLCRRSTSSHD